jgi:hypothetical protein
VEIVVPPIWSSTVWNTIAAASAATASAAIRPPSPNQNDDPSGGKGVEGEPEQIRQ